jgi:hypothetical protein
VRTYDSNAGNWTTPDAVAGQVHDPKTQKSYMWNHNDPLSYGDPSGYEPQAPWDMNVYGPASGGLGYGRCFDCMDPADPSVQAAAADLYNQTHPGIGLLDDSAIPVALVIDRHVTVGNFTWYTYRLINSEGTTVTGYDYLARESVEPALEKDHTLNGVWFSLRAAGDPHEIVDQSSPVSFSLPSSANWTRVQFQTWSIIYQGVEFDLPNVLVHETDVVNGAATNKVYQIAPPSGLLPPW